MEVWGSLWLTHCLVLVHGHGREALTSPLASPKPLSLLVRMVPHKQAVPLLLALRPSAPARMACVCWL